MRGATGPAASTAAAELTGALDQAAAAALAPDTLRPLRELAFTAPAWLGPGGCAELVRLAQALPACWRSRLP